ncbi:M15 family metallopeptidase [Aquimarina sp. AU474]|uniref:M15 family metallopeptidase n=1 Tax=Aquimarina sp. AU474 TaxID=2108529 RepID=UPI001F203881|nr:M15 family metallopeptidase [Aquimarina sp. AU474]
MIERKLVLLIFSVVFFACNNAKVVPGVQTLGIIEKSKALRLRGEKVEQSMLKKKDSIESLFGEKKIQNTKKDNDFVNIESLSNNFSLDMKYATSDNFLKEKVYSCAKCYVRYEVAKALVRANKDFIRKGYKIKLFDCYRPHSVQKKMWKIVPDPGYVANPKGGSVHNRGAAVDITLTDLKGNELDMGTSFDHFGKEASHAYAQLPKKVIANRKVLRSVMEKHGFTTIRTEWWHYNFSTGKKFKISDFTWKCD